MINPHLNILHLPPNTPDPKVNEVSKYRYDNLIEELKIQNITDYSLIDGFFDPVNMKMAIHKGHRKIVQSAKDNDLPNVIIAEDDIKFTHPNSFKYFLSQIPESYDLFCGLVYSAEVKDNRILNGGSGCATLYVVNNRFYDFFLSMNIDNHVDREILLTGYKHEYYVVNPYVCIQRGGWSHQLRQEMFYGEYLRDVKLYEG